MRTLNIPLEDKDYEELLLAKGKDNSWKQFILDKCLNNKKEPNDLDSNFNIEEETKLI